MREQIRNWTETYETFVLEVIFEQRKGKRAAIMRAFLFVLSKIFEGLVSSFSDQFSLAATYHELITGGVPFRGRGLYEQILLVTSTEPDLSGLVEADRPIVARALSKAPQDRFPSCTAFVRALQDAPAPGSGPALRPQTTLFEFDLNTVPTSGVLLSLVAAPPHPSAGPAPPPG